jgi:hypothetical protein
MGTMGNLKDSEILYTHELVTVSSESGSLIPLALGVQRGSQDSESDKFKLIISFENET